MRGPNDRTVGIPDGLWDRTHRQALTERVTASEIVRKALHRYLADPDKTEAERIAELKARDLT